jgi:hypothetical protein
MFPLENIAKVSSSPIIYQSRIMASRLEESLSNLPITPSTRKTYKSMSFQDTAAATYRVFNPKIETLSLETATQGCEAYNRLVWELYFPKQHPISPSLSYVEHASKS